jgi:hypothetical protein
MTIYFFAVDSKVENTKATSLESSSLMSFKSAVAGTMAGVRTSSIQILKVTKYTASTSSRGTKSEYHRFRQESSTADVFIISWNVTIVLQSLGFTSGSDAYSSLTQQIAGATSSGLLAERLASLDSVFTNVSVANTYFNVLAPTAMPTAAPRRDGNQLHEIYIDVGIAIGAAIAAAFIFLYMKRLHLNQKQKVPRNARLWGVRRNSNNDSFGNSPLAMNYHPRSASIYYEDNPSRMIRKPRIERSIQRTYL